MADGKEEAEFTRKYTLIRVRGLPCCSIFFSNNTLEDALDFKPRDNDIFVVSYPKCGTTWATYIVWEILHKGAVPPSPNKMWVQEIPSLEFTGTKNLDNIPPPRAFKTHFPFHLQPYNPNSKYIYVVRNPWDCCVSYYHYCNKMYNLVPQLAFDEFFELFITGEVGFGDFFDHVLSWFGHRNDPNVLFLTYEETKEDKKKSLLKIAKFLGESYYSDLLNDDQFLENCLKHTDFMYMKGLRVFVPKLTNEKSSDNTELKQKFGEVDRSTTDPEQFREVDFFRKGEVGDWKNHFSQNHIKKFNEYMLRKIRNTEMEMFWKLLPEKIDIPLNC